MPLKSFTGSSAASIDVSDASTYRGDPVIYPWRSAGRSLDRISSRDAQQVGVCHAQKPARHPLARDLLPVDLDLEGLRMRYDDPSDLLGEVAGLRGIEATRWMQEIYADLGSLIALAATGGSASPTSTPSARTGRRRSR